MQDTHENVYCTVLLAAMSDDIDLSKYISKDEQAELIAE
jgi:hypothetical protein